MSFSGRIGLLAPSSNTTVEPEFYRALPQGVSLHPARLPITVDEMLLLTRAVARGTQGALIVADMPFGSFQVSNEATVEQAVRAYVEDVKAVRFPAAEHCY